MQDFMKSPRVLQKIEADQRKVILVYVVYQQMLSARKATSSTMAARDYANNSVIKNNQALQSVLCIDILLVVGIHEEAGSISFYSC